LLCASSICAAEVPRLEEIKVESSLDGSMQPARIWAPASARSKTTTLFVFLHSWSGDYRQDNSKWFEPAAERGWIILHPNFRGRNDHPEACGSALARRDIIDAIDYAIAHYKVDESRLYLAGSSGGGHMSLLMAGYHPERFSAVSAWVGISDLAKWHKFHVKNGKPGRYAKMIEACVGGKPGSSPEVDAALKARSPIYHLGNAKGLPLHINAGAEDGYTGSVPTLHSLHAFNVVARANGKPAVAEGTVTAIWETKGLLGKLKQDYPVDPLYGRRVFFHRKAGPAEVTIFDGGHESVPAAALAWLAQFERPTERPEFKKIDDKKRKEQ
jgi:pimeloyl-ACP methyl ester carboxylesterase